MDTTAQQKKDEVHLVDNQHQQPSSSSPPTQADNEHPDPMTVSSSDTASEDVADPSTTNPFQVLLLSHKDTDILTLSAARRMLPLDFPPVATANLVEFKSADDMIDLVKQKIPTSKTQVIIIVRLLGRGVPGFQYLLDTARRNHYHLIVVSGIPGSFEPDLTAMCNVSVEVIHRAIAYFHADGCSHNMANLLRFLADHLLQCGFEYNPPTAQPGHGLYHPRFVNDRDRDSKTAAHLVECHKERKERAKPTIAVVFYRCHFLSANTAFVDAVIDELEALDCNATGLFTESLREHEPVDNVNGMTVERFPTALTHLLHDKTGDCMVDVLISTMAFALGEVNPDGPTIGNWSTPGLQALNVPVLQAITSVDTVKKWRDSPRGLNPLDTAMNVAIPEFDGRIITVPISFKSPQDETNNVHYYEPLQDRVMTVAKQAVRLGLLRHKPNCDKRVAFMLTNSSGKAQRIGDAVGLDTPASLLLVFDAMRAANYTLGDDNLLPSSGDQLMQDLIDRCSYDTIHLTEQQLANAAGHVPAKVYHEMFDRLPNNQKQQMQEQWGAPPGEAYIHDDKIALAGLEFGNVFVALQPP